MLDKAITPGETTQTVAGNGISLNQATLSMLVGSSFQLTAVIAPPGAASQDLTWSSSDASIASVDQTGLVQGLAVDRPPSPPPRQTAAAPPPVP